MTGVFTDWLVEAWAWLRRVGVPSALGRRGIVTPTAEDFPVDPELEGDALADDYLLFVQEHAGLSEWPLWVAAEGDIPESDDGFAVPYARSQLDDPCALIWQLARGVAYCAIQASAAPPPGAEDERWIDATAVYLGYGLFGALAHARTRSRGLLVVCQSPPALSEPDLLAALALYGILGEIPDRTIEAYLGATSRGVYRGAVKRWLRHHARDLARLRGLVPAPRGPYR